NLRNLVSRWINILEDKSNEDNKNKQINSNSDDEELKINITNISNLSYSTKDQNFK
ncbi:15000_t:CDS:1, partial [Funneliformis caledonium]